MPDLGPFDPPRPVWVRVPPAGRQTEAMGWPGFLHRWARSDEWGGIWTALVSYEHREPYWTTAGNVRPR